MKKRRRPYQPSTGAKLAALIAPNGKLSVTPSKIDSFLESNWALVVRLAGSGALAAWAISQLSTAPFVAAGWPNPCKAARMSMGRAAKQ